MRGSFFSLTESPFRHVTMPYGLETPVGEEGIPWQTSFSNVKVQNY